MLYDSYREKLAKWTRVFRHAWRFRLLIAAGLLVLLAGIGALMGVKGIVVEASVPETAYYGQSLAATAQCVFGEAEFEYRALGTDAWSREEPRTVGEYECRAVGKSVVGTDRAGETHAFRILPVRAEVRAAESYLVYGEAPKFTAPLCYDDTLVVDGYTVEREGDLLTVEAGKVSVKNAAGEDVTSSYELVTVGRTVTERLRPVTLRTPSATFGYDGKPHGEPTFEVSSALGLLEGHVVEADYPVLTEAGRLPNRPSNVRVLDAAGEDVTENYDLTVEAGTLTVEKRQLTVGALSASFEYDGLSHAYGCEVLAGTLADGQVFVPAERTFSAAGVYETAPMFSILEDGVEKTGNYAVETVAGKIEIARRRLTVTAPSDDFVYDGQTHRYDELGDFLVEGDLVEGHSLRLSNVLSVSEAGEYADAPAVSVYEGGTRRTENYEISVVPGRVTVGKRALTVTAKSEEFYYDGQAHRYDRASDVSLGGDLVAGQSVRLSGNLSFTDAGQYPNAPAVEVYAGTVRRTDNYEISVVPGEIVINMRTVRVRTGSRTWVYDGTEHAYDSGDAFSALPSSGDDDGLAAGHRLTVSSSTRIAAVSESGARNEMTFAVRSGAADVTRNYTVTIEEYGTLTVTKRPVSLRTASGSWVYDGRPHSDGTVEAVAGGADSGLAAGHRAACTPTAPDLLPAQKEVGNAENNFGFTRRIVDGSGGDVTENYEISDSVVYGTLEITPRPLSLRTASGSWVYDGQPHSDGTVEAVAGGANAGLAAGHELSASPSGVVPSRTEAGETVNNFGFTRRILDENGGDVTANYEISGSVAYGTLTVTRRIVSLLTGSGSHVYDAEPFTVASWSVAGGSLPFVEGHTLGEIVYPAFTDVMLRDGTAGPVVPYSNEIETDAVRVVAAGTGEDVTKNYELRWSFGPVTIEKRPVTIRTESGEWVYDGLQHSMPNATLVPAEGYPLIEGHTVTYNLPTILVGVESRLNSSGWFSIQNARGTSVFGNYDLTYDYGTLTVTPRPLKISSGDATWVYDGAPHSPGDETISAEPFSEGRGLLARHVARLSVRPTLVDVTDEPTRVGYVRNAIEVGIVDGSGADVTGNYEIEYESFGNLRIKAPVTVRVFSDLRSYDGTPLTFGEDSWLVESCPPDVEAEWVTVTLAGSVTDVGTLTLAEARALASARIADGDRDLTAENRVDLVGAEELLVVKPRVICIRCATVSRRKGDAPLVASELEEPYWFSRGKLVEGHEIVCTVLGELAPDAEEAVTTMDAGAIRVYDGAGRDVTANYSFEVKDGFLRWLPDEP